MRRMLLLVPLVLAGCQSGKQTAVTLPQDPAKPIAATQSILQPVQHVVICWLRSPGDSTARQKLIDASKALREIPGVIDVQAGTPLPSSRPVVDTTYDVGVTMTFESPEALKAYQTHPLHIKLTRETLMPLTDRILIYDFQEPSTGR